MPRLQPRDLAWEGCLNVRELGGLPTRDGGETQLGAVVRADSVRQLSDDGWQSLVDHGVRTVVDLRGDDEWHEMAAEIDAAVKAAPDVSTATRDVYLIFLERFRGNMAAAVRAVAHAPGGGVVIHCAGGKDRTGLLTALLLHVSGVGIDEIAADYALSEERLRPRHEQWFAEAETQEELERMKRMSQTPAESIEGVFEELERRYGSVEGYLRGAGLTEDVLDRARARLRD